MPSALADIVGDYANDGTLFNVVQRATIQQTDAVTCPRNNLERALAPMLSVMEDLGEHMTNDSYTKAALESQQNSIEERKLARIEDAHVLREDDPA